MDIPRSCKGGTPGPMNHNPLTKVDDVTTTPMLYGYNHGGSVCGLELEGDTLYFLNGRGRSENMRLDLTAELRDEMRKLMAVEHWVSDIFTVKLDTVYDVELQEHCTGHGVAHIIQTYDRGNGFIDGRTAEGTLYRWNDGQADITRDTLSAMAEILRDLAATLDEHE